MVRKMVARRSVVVERIVQMNKTITHIGPVILLAVAFIPALSSCSVKGEQAEVKEEASQIEEARIAGRESAREFVRGQWKDTFELQQKLIEAGARRGEYEGRPKSTAAYDSAFISTIRTVRPEVAEALERGHR